MKKMKKVTSVLTVLFVGLGMLFLGGCKDDPVKLRSTTYRLGVKDVLGVSGTVTFTETSATEVTVDIAITGETTGNHPAQLCMKSAIEKGPVLANLNQVDASGVSSTKINSITYAELIDYNGYVKVMKSTTEPDIILAQGDIGGNVLTSISKSYPLATKGSYGVFGSALFQKRVNGHTLVTITLNGTIAGDFYPVTVNLGSVASVGGGPIIKNLQDVDGTTGKSFTNIIELNNGTPITYDNWLVYDGYINVYQTTIASGVLICQGNIGSN